MYSHPLAARAGATEEFDAAFRYIELFSEEFDQRCIGFAIHRRCSEADFQGIPMQAANFGFPGTWLDVQR